MMKIGGEGGGGGAINKQKGGPRVFLRAAKATIERAWQSEAFLLDQWHMFMQVLICNIL